jgi:hypothetical protein
MFNTSSQQGLSQNVQRSRTFSLRDLFVLMSMLSLLAAAIGHVYRSTRAVASQGMSRSPIVFPSLPMSSVNAIVNRGGWITQFCQGELSIYFGRCRPGCGNGSEYRREFGNIGATDAGVTFNDGDVQHLLALRELRGLDLSNTAVTELGLEKLVDHPCLEHLLLDRLDVTDAGLKHLQRMKSLKSLVIIGCQVSQASLADFAKARPDVRLNGGLPTAEDPVESLTDADEFQP